MLNIRMKTVIFFPIFISCIEFETWQLNVCLRSLNDILAQGRKLEESDYNRLEW